MVNETGAAFFRYVYRNVDKIYLGDNGTPEEGSPIAPAWLLFYAHSKEEADEQYKKVFKKDEAPPLHVREPW